MNQKGFTLFELVVGGFIAFVFIIILLWFVFWITVGVKSCSSIQERGLKSVVEEIWEGPNAPK